MTEYKRTGKCEPKQCKVFPASPTQGFYQACEKLGCTYKFVKKTVKNKHKRNKKSKNLNKR